MMPSVKGWASVLGFDRDCDEKTMAARARVLARTLAYLDEHFSDPDGPRPAEQVVIEFGQFLVLAEGMESKARAGKIKDLYETIVRLYLEWDTTDRDAVFRQIEEKIAVFKGIVAFSDAWLGTVTSPMSPAEERGGEVLLDPADVKTRIVRRSDYDG